MQFCDLIIASPLVSCKIMVKDHPCDFSVECDNADLLENGNHFEMILPPTEEAQ
jgi:hypothetical protein